MALRSMLLILVISSNVWTGAAAYCSWCQNAPSRGWSWLFGWGDCKCHDGWSGDCCDEWSVSDWNQKVADWSRGESCEAQPDNACKLISNVPESTNYVQTWKYAPSTQSSSQQQCEDNGCMWVECFEASGKTLPFSTSDPSAMCYHCEGPWKGKCEWKHYEPGFLAFAGPGKHCGFSYPVCPAIEGKNCFCGEAATKVKEGWCDNGTGISTFCPNAMQHTDGRTQECSWNGWTVSPSGGIDTSCKAWGLA